MSITETPSQNWDSKQEHPCQTRAYISTQEESKYRFFSARNGKNIAFFLTKFGPFTIANALFPSNNKAALQEFLAACSKKLWLPMVVSYKKMPFLGFSDEAFTYLVDTKNISYAHGIKYNLRQAEKNKVEVRKVENWEGFAEFNDVHNSLLKRKGIPFDPSKREQMYKKLFALNNKGALLYGAFEGDKMIAGLVVTYAGNYGLFTKAATLEEFYSHAPLPLLITQVCEREKNRFEWLDMNVGIGGKYESKGHVFNIIKFKKQFGKRVPVYVHMPSWLYAARQAYLRIKHGRLSFPNLETE